MSKKLYNLAFIAIAIIGLTTVSSCKKGENDPFLSLKSRKSRISGEWKLVEGTSTSTSTFGGITNSSTTTFTSTSYSESGGNTFAYTEKMTIVKDGTYEVQIMDDGDSFTVKGVWFFSGKIKDLDLKNKEAIVMVAQEFSEVGYVETYNGLYGGDVMIIDQLKNKEVIFKGGYTSSGTGFTNSSTYERTFEKQ